MLSLFLIFQLYASGFFWLYALWPEVLQPLPPAKRRR